MTSSQPQPDSLVDAMDRRDYAAAVTIHLRRTRPTPIDVESVRAVIDALTDLGVGPDAATMYRLQA